MTHLRYVPSVNIFLFEILKFCEYLSSSYIFTQLYLALAVLSLRCCMGFSLVVVSGVCSLFVMHRRLIELSSLAEEHWISVSGFSSCGF